MRRTLLIFAAVLAVGTAAAQQSSSWVVRPQWVHAHEAFLASDAMRGRGSATHDEQVAATYVASEFEAYGLQTAPGMATYIQTAEVSGPQLGGTWELAAASLHLDASTGLTVLRTKGGSLSGPLLKLNPADANILQQLKGARGCVVLLTTAPLPESARTLSQALDRSGALALLQPATPATERSFIMGGGKPRVSIALTGEESRSGPRASVAALAPAALAKLTAMADGTTVSLRVPVVADPPQRHTYNAIGYLPGTDPHAGTLLLTAHLDHLGIGQPVAGDAIWNGADDDAAGTTAVLELAHALAAGPRLRRSVLFVCFGSEELGDLGSTYFGEHPPVPLKSLVANLEFEMIGIQDPGMPKGVLLLTGWERSNLGPTLAAHGALLGPDPYPEEHYFQRSDNYALALQGVVAHTAAGWGSGPTYHHPDDDLAHIDIPFMTAAIQSLVEPVRWLAQSDFVPTWNPGQRPEPRP